MQNKSPKDMLKHTHYNQIKNSLFTHRHGAEGFYFCENGEHELNDINERENDGGFGENSQFSSNALHWARIQEISCQACQDWVLIRDVERIDRKQTRDEHERYVGNYQTGVYLIPWKLNKR